MNERIEKMMLEATKDIPQGYYVPPQYFEKFAELIVKECMKLNSKELSITAIERLLPLYAEHFGVEE